MRQKYKDAQQTWDKGLEKSKHRQAQKPIILLSVESAGNPLICALPHHYRILCRAILEVLWLCQNVNATTSFSMPLSKTNKLRWKVLLKEERNFSWPQSPEYSVGRNEPRQAPSREPGNRVIEKFRCQPLGTFLAQSPNSKGRIMRYSCVVILR